MIDLTKLNYKDEIVIDEEVIIPKEYYKDTDIIDLENVFAKGKITNSDEGYLINIDVSGTMILNDSITFEEIPYDFTINIQKILENSNKTLDFILFLWHYIILEIPLRYTKNEGNYVKNKNYQVISEEEYKMMNNPFNDFHFEEGEDKDGSTF